MKKLFFYAVASLFCMSAYAQEWDTVTLLEGSTDFARSGQLTNIVVDMSHAVDVEYDDDWNVAKVNGTVFETVGEKSFYDSFKNAWREMKMLLGRGKKKANCIQLPAYDAENPAFKYEMKYDIDTLDTGDGAAAFWVSGMSQNAMKNGGMIAVGTLTVTDLDSGDVVCKMRLNRTKGVIMAGMALRGAFYIRISGLLCNVMIYDHMLDYKPNTLTPKKK